MVAISVWNEGTFIPPGKLKQISLIVIGDTGYSGTVSAGPNFLELLQRWREIDRTDNHLLEALFASDRGIAQALQNTG